jgi:PKD domain/Kelch motif
MKRKDMKKQDLQRVVIAVLLVLGMLASIFTVRAVVTRASGATATWALTGSMSSSRELHTATLLPNGEVLVAGGGNNTGALASAELYDPTTGNWTPTGSMNVGRAAATATLLSDGEVLVAGGQATGGQDLTSAEIYDPTTGTWAFTGSMNVARYSFTATLLPDGTVLAAGGTPSFVGNTRLASAELFSLGAVTTPSVSALANATINEGDIYSANGSFTDPGATSWTATVDYGDGSGVQPLPLSGTTFSLSHAYSTIGSYTVTVSVTDNQGATGTATATITVIPTTTVTFNDHSANQALNGTYASIGWGTGDWDVDGPIATDSTNSISFHTSTVTGEPFSFAGPEVLLSTQVYSNSPTTAMITLSCAGNPTVDAVVAPGTVTTLTTDWQTPCTTVTVTSSNSWNTNLDNLVYSSIPNSTLPPTPPPPPANTYGYTTQGAQLDTGDATYMNGSKFTTGASASIAQSMSVFVGNVESGSHNQYQVAIYTDSSGVPGTFVAQSASGTLTPLSWNTLSISASLQPNTTYWLMYNTNATSSTNYLNNLYFDPGSQGVAAWAKHSFGSWPFKFPTATLDTTQFSMYVTDH